ncbi:5-bromo-4-chloroindolyl phosphate hydrolysis family protein [Konateibacter massiliensis]|uniref:5-bromo-4-chloroindolyl phosphate hydrolysis family protein n=1 Tax=Konateibacter massiliensis TaxID=2002841 RepID=UPI000C150E0A|nr:5-bromo-4-chloroindolyl phosphate hydrolysis family protein [Konateibacter massiliensis]
MNNKNFSNLEDEIKNIVQNAINSKDFKELNQNIGDTVESAISEVQKALGLNRSQGQSKSRRSNHWQDSQPEFKVNFDTEDPYTRQRSNSRRSYSQQRRNRRTFYEPPYKAPTKQTSAAYPSNPTGKVAGILYTVFGWIFLPITGLAVLVLTLLGVLLQRMNIFGSIALGILPLLLISFALTVRGSTLRARLRRFYRYMGLFKEQTYYSIKDLASQTQLSDKFIIKDLRKMISLGMFPEGHIDAQGTCIMLNQQSYRQYTELLKSQQMQQEEITKKARQQADAPKAATPVNEELHAAVENGRACIRQIRKANDAIPGEEISRKLDRLETVIDKIFTHVEEHPEQLSEINKFMEYYLPTTLKLVTAYQEFDVQPVQGENIRSAKNEIETTLDTINHAFEILLDSLFEDAALDISTDISVLETILAQEGLTKSKLKSGGN